MSDQVNRPEHYTSHPSGVECITITEHMNFNLGNAVKYLWRAGLKGDALEDLKKARWYVEREIQRLEMSETAPRRNCQPWEPKLYDRVRVLGGAVWGGRRGVVTSIDPESPYPYAVRTDEGLESNFSLGELGPCSG